MRKQCGFTLIELLVVIAIIAILAAILFPVFAKVREKARQASCASNEKQLGLGVLQYVQDYDEKYPGSNVNFASYGAGWAGQIYSYEKSVGVYRCPDDAGTLPFLSYSANINITSPNIAVAGQSLALAQLNSPSKTVLLYEAEAYPADPTQPGEVASVASNCYNAVPAIGYGDFATGLVNNCYWSDSAIGTGNPRFGGVFSLASGRHTDGANYLAADGHVKWMRGAALSGSNTPGSGGAAGEQWNCTGAAAPNGVASATNMGKSNSPQDTTNFFQCAEGTDYGGADAYAMTFSTL